MKFNTPWTRSAPALELNDSESLTVPNDHITVRQLFERSARGLPLNVRHLQPIYTNEDFDDYQASEDLNYEYPDYERDRAKLALREKEIEENAALQVNAEKAALKAQQKKAAEKAPTEEPSSSSSGDAK